jgi:hypothetical protein
MNDSVEIVAPRQSLVFGPLILVAGLGAIGTGIWSIVVNIDALPSIQIVAVSFPFLLGWLFYQGGRMLSSKRGGMVCTPEHLLLFGDSSRDHITVRLNQITDIVVHCVLERWGDEVHALWMCEATVKDGPRIVLAQSDDEHALKHMAHIICEGVKRPEPTIYENDTAPEQSSPTTPLGDAPAGIVASQHALVMTVGAAGALARTLLAGGVVSLIVGVILLLDVKNNGALGFMFGPFLGVMGLVLGAIPICKTLLFEHMQVGTDGTLTHHVRALSWRGAEKTLSLKPGWYVRIRQRGMHGGCVEVVSDGRIVTVCSGVHTRSRIQPDGLFWVGRFVQRRASAGSPSAGQASGDVDH